MTLRLGRKAWIVMLSAAEAFFSVSTDRASAQTVTSVVQYSYDTNKRLQCTAVRMNPAVYGALPASACTLGTAGTQGPDRITKNVYDVAGQLTQVRKAVGTADEAAYATYSYTPNGKQEYVIDAAGNRAKMEYDGFDRLQKWIFPSKTLPSAYNPASQATALATAGTLNTADYEQYAYDANGNRTSLRKRDGSVLGYSYDNLNRVTLKTVPARAGLAATHTRSVYYGYDLRGLQLYARFDSTTGEGVTNAFDGLGRQTSTSVTMDGVTRTVSYLYDANGNRTRVTFPDGNYATYGYDGLDRPNLIQRSGTATIAAYTYDAAGRRNGFNNNTVPASATLKTSYGYDGINRLTSLANTLTGDAASSNTYGFAYNPASQITTLSKSNTAFSFAGTYNVNRGYAVNGLNQYTSAGPASFTYDTNGNLTGDGSATFLYDIENRLVTAGGTRSATLRYDPLGRLYEATSPTTGTTRFLYGGDELLAEYNSAGNLLRRYVHGADGKADDPLAWYEGSAYGATNERFLRPDWQGSIGLVTANSGANVLAINTYDEYGIPGPTNTGRFQYTGQAWMPELGMYYYKARIYSPTLGRFLQTDPIGYKDQINLYGYVANDPVNRVDYLGTYSCGAGVTGEKCTQFLTAQRSAAAKLAAGLETAKQLRSALSAGKKAGAGTEKIAALIEKYVGKGYSADASKLNQVISKAEGALAGLRGSKPFDYNSNASLGFSLTNNPFSHGQIYPQFYASDKVGDVAHDAFHENAGVTDAGGYSESRLIEAARRPTAPNGSLNNAESLSKAFGF